MKSWSPIRTSMHATRSRKVKADKRDAQLLVLLEPVEGFEPPTRSLQNCRSTPELHRHGCGMVWRCSIRSRAEILPNSSRERQIRQGNSLPRATSARCLLKNSVDALVSGTVGLILPKERGRTAPTERAAHLLYLPQTPWPQIFRKRQRRNIPRFTSQPINDKETSRAHK